MERVRLNTRSIGLPSDKDLRVSADALKRAALQARELARQTGTGLAIYRDGKVVIVSPDDLDKLDDASVRPAGR
jgi:hypothetical protein